MDNEVTAWIRIRGEFAKMRQCIRPSFVTVAPSVTITPTVVSTRVFRVAPCVAFVRRIVMRFTCCTSRPLPSRIAQTITCCFYTLAMAMASSFIGAPQITPARLVAVVIWSTNGAIGTTIAQFTVAIAHWCTRPMSRAVQLRIAMNCAVWTTWDSMNCAVWTRCARESEVRHCGR